MTAKPWFRFEGQWHLYVGEVAGNFESLCRIALKSEPKTVTGTDDAPYPPKDRCHRCFVADAMTYVEDEPLDVARERGFIPVEPLAWD